jgi:hypothetical protein
VICSAREFPTPALRKIVYASIVSALLLLLLPTKGRWSPPPESLRFGPLSYDSRVSKPLNSLISQEFARPTDLTLRLKFRQFGRPTDYAFLISTATGFGRGLKVSTDRYGNFFLSIGKSSDAIDDYQLIKVSDPVEIEQTNTLEVQVSGASRFIHILLNNRPVSAAEARPNMSFQPSQIFLNVSNLEIGGSGGNDFSGNIEDVEIVFGRTSTTVDALSLKLTFAVVVLMGLVFLVGRVNRAGSVSSGN